MTTPASHETYLRTTPTTSIGLSPAVTESVNLTLIRLGFNVPQFQYKSVEYDKALMSKIFEYIPQGLNYGLGISNAAAHSIQPYDTRLYNDYVTTLVLG